MPSALTSGWTDTGIVLSGRQGIPSICVEMFLPNSWHFVTFRWTKSRKTHGQHCDNIYKQLTTQSLRGSKKVGEILSFVQSLTFCIKKSSWWGRGTPGRLHGCPPRIDNGNWKMKPKMKRLQDFRIPKRESSSDIFSKVPVVYGSLDALWSPFFFETPENSHGTRKM